MYERPKRRQHTTCPISYLRCMLIVGVHIKRNPFFSVALLPFFGPRPPLCHGFETIQFLCGEDFSLAPNPHHGGPGYLPVFVRHFTQHVSGTDGPTRN